MNLQPIVYVTDMSTAISFFEKVLGRPPVYRSAIWSSFSVGSATLGLHRTNELPSHSRVELSLISEAPLESVIEQLAAVGITPKRGIQDETFGRSLVLEDPNGFILQVNEHGE